MKSITFIPYRDNKRNVCTCVITDLVSGKNKSTFNVPLDCVNDIVECNLFEP